MNWIIRAEESWTIFPAFLFLKKKLIWKKFLKINCGKRKKKKETTKSVMKCPNDWIDKKDKFVAQIKVSSDVEREEISIALIWITVQ